MPLLCDLAHVLCGTADLASGLVLLRVRRLWAGPLCLGRQVTEVSVNDTGGQV